MIGSKVVSIEGDIWFFEKEATSKGLLRPGFVLMGINFKTNKEASCYIVADKYKEVAFREECKEKVLKLII